MPDINGDRLWDSIMTLAKVGGFLDDVTGLYGVNRLALTDADRDGRRLVSRWFEEAGLEVRVDQIGNCYGRRAGRAELPAVMCGSHIDSVPTGGAFDGALGVLAALEAVRTLNDLSIETQHPIEIGFFSDEEGARFGTDMLGSAVATGRIALEDAYLLTDKSGTMLKDALSRIGFLGAEPVNVKAPHAYLELHIEQGPCLASAGVDLGVVTGVQAISWRELTIVGRAAHAGTTPMSLRKDASHAASRIEVFLHELVKTNRFGDGFRVTMGRRDVQPNRVNVVAQQVITTVDLRNPDDAAMNAAEAELDACILRLEKELGVRIESKQTSKTHHVQFAASIQDVISKRIQERGLTHQKILSGAGHDAQEFARICPTAMIFVPGEYEGISHNPREYSRPEACAQGANILLDAMLDLAG